jgi:hypothetical protein
MKMIRNFWALIVSPPTADALAKRELANAMRNYLEHQTHLEYYQSQVNFERQRIARLEAYLK